MAPGVGPAPSPLSPVTSPVSESAKLTSLLPPLDWCISTAMTLSPGLNALVAIVRSSIALFPTLLVEYSLNGAF